MRCPKCNGEIPDAASFCSFCGTRIESQAVFCPACGTSQPPNAVYCIKCGTNIKNNGYEANTQQQNTHNTGTNYGTHAVTPDSVTVYYKTGNGVFGTNTIGKLSVSSSGVAFASSFSLSTKEVNHAYSFDSISSTEFRMTRAGLQPQMGYHVVLKNGTEHHYVYDIMHKSALQRIDNTIKSQIR